ncbi:MAG: OsmC family protein [Bacteroidales bacterium]|jgi:putative redox protein|nr:OsmC family protein [Bacteroidales bacterium]MDI9592358.1 OsmC family protein [Bacteroidota bacterium]NLH33408.1 osmotically inducible protein C [Lentimicrobium sp.]OQC37282.1 MAG: OsmC-like protein [Bacteroidetes bacterium ADurb.Bin041]MBP7874376.1 OsmC family protein [Bacteroidales bacterium]
MEMKIFFEGKKKVTAEINGQIIPTDQPVQSGGDGSAPAPFTLFLASIGTCAGIYIKSFCDQRNIPTDEIYITQKMNYNYKTRLIDHIELKVNLPASFPEKYKPALINAANLCAVKEHFKSPPEIEVNTYTFD